MDSLTQFKITRAAIPIFLNNDNLSQIVMSAFEVLPKETFGLLFGKISTGKVFISSVQPSQEVVSREVSSVQPDGQAINRLQNLKSRLGTTDLVGSYHSHVYLTDREIESISKGASPSDADLRNLLSSTWRNVLVIVGFFANEGWNLPLKESGWKKEGAVIYCNKRVEALGYRFFHIRVSSYMKSMGRINQIPISISSGSVQMEENRAICSICGGEAQGGVCKHCGSRLD
jgi:proteasome lid subunit RPN8/RPN11